MFEILRFVVTFLGFAVVLTLAVLNRGTVPFMWSPLHPPVNVPVMVIVLAGVGVGFIWGAVISWVNNAPARVEARTNAKLVREMTERLHQSEHAAIRDQLGDSDDILMTRKKWWRMGR